MLLGWVGYWIVESRSVSGWIARCLDRKSVHYSTSQQLLAVLRGSVSNIYQSAAYPNHSLTLPLQSSVGVRISSHHQLSKTPSHRLYRERVVSTSKHCLLLFHLLTLYLSLACTKVRSFDHHLRSRQLLTLSSSHEFDCKHPSSSDITSNHLLTFFLSLCPPSNIVFHFLFAPLRFVPQFSFAPRRLVPLTHLPHALPTHKTPSLSPEGQVKEQCRFYSVVYLSFQLTHCPTCPLARPHLSRFQMAITGRL